MAFKSVLNGWLTWNMHSIAWAKAKHVGVSSAATWSRDSGGPCKIKSSQMIFLRNLCMMWACWERSGKMGKVSFIVLSLSSTGRSRYLARIGIVGNCCLNVHVPKTVWFWFITPIEDSSMVFEGSIYSLNHMSMYTGIYRSIYPSSYPSIHPAIRPSINCSSHLAALSTDLSSGSILRLHRNSRPTTIQLQRGPVVSRTELLYVAVCILSNLQANAWVNCCVEFQVQMAAVTLGCGDGCDGVRFPSWVIIAGESSSSLLWKLLCTFAMEGKLVSLLVKSCEHGTSCAQAMLAHCGLFLLNGGCGYVLILVFHCTFYNASLRFFEYTVYNIKN